MKTMPKPKRPVTKNGREMTGNRVRAKASVQTASSVNDALSTTSGTPSQADMQTQAATRLFLQRIEKIADAQIVRRGHGELYLVAFTVEVPSFLSTVADQVYTLRGDLHRKYPKAQIEVEVRGRRECGGAMDEMEQDEEQ